MAYPKASAPVTAVVYEMANARADRWKKRCADARTEAETLRKRVKELEDAAR